MSLIDGHHNCLTKHTLLEAAAVFIVGVATLTFIYDGSVAPANGVPGVDSYYHIKMAELLPQHGFVDQFPWLRFCYFSETTDNFVSHHHGFQILLLPFIEFAKWCGSDALAGGRWAMCAIFGASFATLYLILVSHRLRWPMLWLLVVFLLPAQFFGRHAFVRAPGPSLTFMLLILLAVFRRRYVMAGIVVAGYNHLYLGGVLYSPVIIGACAIGLLTGKRRERRDLIPLIGWSVSGWVLGVLTHPYLGGMAEFLQLQVFGSGLSPDIEVGREWKPYQDVWWFARMIGPLAIVWCTVMCLRLRRGPKLDHREFTVLLLQFGFLALTLKARRFIEYWPAMALLSAALASRPLLNDVHRLWVAPHPWRRPLTRAVGGLVAAVVLALAIVRLPSLALIDALSAAPVLPVMAVIAVVAAPLGRMIAQRRCTTHERACGWRVYGQYGALALTTLGAFAIVGADRLVDRREEVACKYDLPAIRSVMTFLESNSNPGDVVFTDDWDVFPVFFYHNDHNNYIVGLDPKFTQHRRPDLWDRFVRITRGQIPRTALATAASGRNDKPSLTDIRDHFGARFVIIDRDHRKLASLLETSGEFARLIYPASTLASCKDAPYLLFEINGNGIEPPSELPETLHLDTVTPQTVQQGWGAYAVGAAVGGGELILNGRAYRRGIGTHAPSRLTFDVPEGYRSFEARVGVDGSVGERGSVVAVVELDGRVAYRSPVLFGGQSVHVRISIQDVRQMTLIAEPAGDGKRFDHVDWVEARLLRGTSQGRLSGDITADLHPNRDSVPGRASHHQMTQHRGQEQSLFASAGGTAIAHGPHVNAHEDNFRRGENR
jgi:hypothetical protein